MLPLPVGAGNQACQVSIALSVLYQEYQAVGPGGIVRIAQPEIRTGNRLHSGGDGRLVEAHQCEQVALVRDSHRRHTGGGHCLDQGLDPDEAVHQGVFRVEVKMDEAGFHGGGLLSRYFRKWLVSAILARLGPLRSGCLWPSPAAAMVS